MKKLSIVLLVLAALHSLGARYSGSRVDAAGLGTGAIEADVQSEYSHILVRRQGNLRSMNFVRDNGVEQVQSVLNLKQPYELVTQYSRLMFASYFFMPQQKQVLIVGLGGGAMVHFYEHYDPDVKVDAVEIDEKVVQLAEKYFDVRTRKNTNIITEDAFKYFKSNKTRYDVIYMDAFLKPSEETDATGQPLRLKTVEFYKGLREQLTPEGIVVINLNIHPRHQRRPGHHPQRLPPGVYVQGRDAQLDRRLHAGQDAGRRGRLAREGQGTRPPLQGHLHVPERARRHGKVSCQRNPAPRIRAEISVAFRSAKAAQLSRSERRQCDSN